MKPILLVILDGFGYKNGSKTINAKTMPSWHKWLKKYPNTTLAASGSAVGLPDGYMGNSEVGHLTIGTGKIIKSMLTKMNESIEDESFFNNTELNQKLKNSPLHIIGLLSDAGVHSHIDHICAFIKLGKKAGAKNIYVHPILDGRDMPPKSATKLLEKLDEACRQHGATIASMHGRYYAMDRDNNWNRIEQSYNVLTTSTTNTNWRDVIERSYSNGVTDEFLMPTQLDSNGFIQSNDNVILTNFRPERAVEISSALTDKNFNKFKRKTFPSIKNFITPVKYTNGYSLFEKETIQNTLLDQLNDKRVLIVAETEKAAHVTYFFKGMRDETSSNEERIIIPSIKTKQYIDNPEMSAEKITDTIIKNNFYEFYLINYANTDMVAHSGNIEATRDACTFIDKQLKHLCDEFVINQDGTLIITADHGNAEEIEGHHTTNPVPFMVLSSKNHNLKGLEGLKDIAYFILKIANNP